MIKNNILIAKNGTKCWLEIIHSFPPYKAKAISEDKWKKFANNSHRENVVADFLLY
jgi:hypothetical protein